MRGGLLRGKPPLLFLRFGILAGQGSFLYAESRNKQNWRDIDMRFLLKILFAPILAVLAVVTWFFVFVVGLSSGILCIPAAILRSGHTLCGFRRLRRGAAGDRVPHKPLRASHAGGMASGKAPRPALRDSGQDLRLIPLALILTSGNG